MKNVKKAGGILIVWILISMLIACGSTEGLDAVNNVSEVSNLEVVVTESEVETEIKAEFFAEAETERVAMESEIETEKEALVEEKYTYKDISATKYAKSSVNVRDIPDSSGNRLGGLSTNDEVYVTGQCNETQWYRIAYMGGVGYVSNSFLADEKNVASSIQTPIATTSDPRVDSKSSSNEIASTETSITENVAISTPETSVVSNVETSESNAATSETVGNPSSVAGTGNVWVSATGSKYHSINNCGKMNPDKAIQMTEKEAQDKGLEACSKCW